MNQNDLKTYIEANRDGQINFDSDANLLDLAIHRGVTRAKHEQWDYRKFFHLAAAILFCIAIHTEPIQNVAKGFLLNNTSIPQSSSEALFYRLHDIRDVVITYLGGHSQ